MLFAACENVEFELYRDSRGWSSDDWHAAREQLQTRGLLAQGGRPTTRGKQMRDQIERRTDELAVAIYEPLGDEKVQDLIAVLRPAARRTAAAGDITFPNPMGLPPPSPSQ